MTIVVGRSPARIPVVAQARRAAAARALGAAAGAVCGGTAVAAHGWAAGGTLPGSTTLTLLLAASVVVGALVTTVRPLRHRASALAGVLFAGQALGHAAMSADAMAMGGQRGLWTPGMLAAHLVAAGIAAVVIRSAGVAHKTLTTAWSRIRLQLLSHPVIFAPLPLRSVYRLRVVLRIVASGLLPTRGPPLLALG